MTIFFTLQEVAGFSDAFEIDPDAASAGEKNLQRPSSTRSVGGAIPFSVKLPREPSLATRRYRLAGQRRGHFRTLKGKMSFVRSAALKKQSLNRELMAKKKLRATAAVAAKKLVGKAAVAGAALLTVGAGVSYLNRRQNTKK